MEDVVLEKVYTDWNENSDENEANIQNNQQPLPDFQRYDVENNEASTDDEGQMNEEIGGLNI